MVLFRENKNKIYLEHGFEAYRMFMTGEEETQTLDNNYRDRLLEYYEVLFLRFRY